MSQMSQIYDVIVVGAGVEGSSTAYQLAKQGYRTLLLEQFPLPHNRGSSHGQSRITRKAYGANDIFSNMMKESYRLIEELERESGEQLFVETGMLVIGAARHAYMNDMKTSLSKHGVPFETFDFTTIKSRFPMLNYPDDYIYVLENGGGLLRADKVVNAFQTQFQRYGGVIKDSNKVLGITPGDIVNVKTAKAEYRSKQVVLACGPWAGKVLEQIGIKAPLKVLRIAVCYWKEKTPGSHGIGKIPSFLSSNDKGSFDVYGLPAEEYPGMVKICLHNGPEVDPDNRDIPDSKWALDQIRKYVNTHFPFLEPTPCIVETCIYTMTPDENFIIDRHPLHPNITIAAGFSGHGFKLAPVIGKVLSEMSTNRVPSYNIFPFRLNRFNQQSSKL